MVDPLNTNSFAINVVVKLLDQCLTIPGLLNCLEVVSHLCKKLLLVDSAVEFPKNFVALVVTDASTRVSSELDGRLHILTCPSPGQER